jgi:hypothetical protein
MCIRVIYVKLLTFSLLLASWLLTPFAISYAQAADPNPPIETVRLIFIHHSTGENWLTDGYGNLGESRREQLLRQRHQLWLGTGGHRRPHRYPQLD